MTLTHYAQKIFSGLADTATLALRPASFLREAEKHEAATFISDEPPGEILGGDPLPRFLTGGRLEQFLHRLSELMADDPEPLDLDF